MGWIIPTLTAMTAAWLITLALGIALLHAATRITEDPVHHVGDHDDV